MEKQKIQLTQEKETLLVPLYSKAVGSQGPHSIIVDPKADEILRHIEYDFGELQVPRQTLITLAMRAKKLTVHVAFEFPRGAEEMGGAVAFEYKQFSISINPPLRTTSYYNLPGIARFVRL